MCSPSESTAILAAAGSRKTETIIESALAVSRGRVLILTYTLQNQRQIIARLEQKVGMVPPNILVMGWFSFLIQHCAKPYQRVLTGEPLKIRGLNFLGARSRFTSKASLRYFLDVNSCLYRDAVADFVVELDKKSDGAVIRRLEKIFAYIFVDEVQDLVGYDLDVLDRLMRSRINLVVVGDPRQHTFSTNLGQRNKRYRGVGLTDWFEERSDVCALESRNFSYRSNQDICSFADAIYPEFPTTRSVGVPATGHDGVFQLPQGLLAAYIALHGPVTMLRYDKNADTGGLPAVNIGVSKGSTFDRVVIFPTLPMLQYLRHGDPKKLKAREKLYVAVTRARYSVAFVVPAIECDAHWKVCVEGDQAITGWRCQELCASWCG